MGLQYEEEKAICRTVSSYLKKLTISNGGVAMATYSPLPEEDASPGTCMNRVG